jgi:hypothetical protein
MHSSLEDRVAVLETVYKYALGIDTRDWGLYRSIFTDEIEVDFSSYDAQTVGRLKADDWVERLKPLFSGLAATQHIMTNPIVTFDKEGATCRIYMQAEHFLDAYDGSTSYAIGGYYTDRLVRHNNQWLIYSVTLTVLWRRGDPDIMVKATEKGTPVAAINKWKKLV